MGPVAHSDGHDLPRSINEVVPGGTAQCDDLIVGFEDTVRQPVVADELPYIFHGVELWCSRRQGQKSDVVRDGQVRRHMPSGLVDDHYTMGPGIDHRADLGQVRLHGVGITPRHDQPRALTLGRADRAKYVGPFGALVVRRTRPCSTLGPSTRDLILLADASLVLKPQLYIRPCREPGSDARQLGRKSFLKSAIANSFWA